MLIKKWLFNHWAMKLEHQFDKVIRDKLKFYQAETSDNIWEKIESQLPGKKNRLIFSLAGIMTISFTLILLYLRITDAGQSAKLPEYNVPTVLPSEKIASEIIITDKSLSLSENNQLLKNKYNNGEFYEQQQNRKLTHTDFTDTDIILKQESIKENAAASETPAEISDQKICSSFSELAIPLLNNATILPSVLDQFYVENREKHKNKDACLIQFDGYRKKYFFEILNSLDLPLKHLKAIGEDQIEYINARKSTEDVLLSFSTGFRAGMTITRNLEIMTGGQFSQINEQFDYTDPESSQTKIIIIKSYVKNNMGETIDSVITQQTIQIPGTHTYKIQNYYRFIDVPVVLGYQIFSKRRFSVFANAGVIANLKFMQKGAILDDDAVTISKFSENKPNDLFLSNAGFSSYTGLSIKYALSPGLQISLEPNLRHQFSSLTNDDYPVAQKYTTFGIQGGIRFVF